MSRLVVAVDPGGRHTGIVLRSGDILHYWALITRDFDFDRYLGEVIDTVTRAKERARELALHNDIFDTPQVLAVEDINDPTPQMRVIHIRGLLDTAQVLGAIAGRWAITRVPPGGHGSHPLFAYPDALVGEGEVAGTGRLRHVRSAWDIARYVGDLPPAPSTTQELLEQWGAVLAQLDRRDKRAVKAEVERQVMERIDRDRGTIDQRVEERVQARLTQVENLSQTVDAFREATGIDLRHTWRPHIDRLAKVWPLATSGREIDVVAKNLRETAELLDGLVGADHA